MDKIDESCFNSMIDNVLKGIISGFLIAYLLIFGLIPSSKYPDDILDIMDNPWIFAIILIINFYILYWDLTIGLLLFISLIALMLDIIIFTDGELFYDDAKDTSDAKDAKDASDAKDTSEGKTEKKKEYLFNKSYKDSNDIVIDKLREYKKLSENNVSAYNSFI